MLPLSLTLCSILRYMYPSLSVSLSISFCQLIPLLLSVYPSLSVYLSLSVSLFLSYCQFIPLILSVYPSLSVSWSFSLGQFILLLCQLILLSVSSSSPLVCPTFSSLFFLLVFILLVSLFHSMCFIVPLYSCIIVLFNVHSSGQILQSNPRILA